MPRPIERRSSDRVPFTGRAIIRAAGRQLSCSAVDLSQGGMLLVPPVQARVGLSMTINFIFPGMNEWASVQSVLARETDIKGHYAWGVQFVQMAPYVKTLVRGYVRRAQRNESGPQMSGHAEPLFSRDPSGPSRSARASAVRRETAATVGAELPDEVLDDAPTGVRRRPSGAPATERGPRAKGPLTGPRPPARSSAARSLTGPLPPAAPRTSTGPSPQAPRRTMRPSVPVTVATAPTTGPPTRRVPAPPVPTPRPDRALVDLMGDHRRDDETDPFADLPGRQERRQRLISDVHETHAFLEQARREEQHETRGRADGRLSRLYEDALKDVDSASEAKPKRKGWFR